MIVIEIDLAQQTVASVVAQAIVHSNSFQTRYRSRAITTNSIPRVAVTVVIEQIDFAIRAQRVRSVSYSWVSVNAARRGPSAKGVRRVEDCFAHFRVGDVATGFGRVQRFFPTADLTRCRIVSRHAIEQHISANDRHDKDRAQDTEKHGASLE